MEKSSDLNVIIASGGTLHEADLELPGSPEISEVERLMNEFEAHEGKEKEFLRCYQEIAQKVNNPLIQFLLQLIISDEERHREVMRVMASTLKGSLNWTKPRDAIRGGMDWGEDKEELFSLTEDFIRTERKGIRECKNLMKASKGDYRGLFALLLQAMIHDSEKHIEILEFLRSKLKEA